MASAQVLPSSRKQEHLEAGKRRLEEFRKKKAAERAKKAGTASQPNASDVGTEKKPVLDTASVRFTDSDGAGTSNGPIEPFTSTNDANSRIDFPKKVEPSSLKYGDAKPSSTSNYDGSFSDLGQRLSDNHDIRRYDAFGFSGAATMNFEQRKNDVNDDSTVYTESQGALPYGILSDHSIDLREQASQGFDGNSGHPSFYGKGSFHSKENNSYFSDSAVTNDSSHVFPSRSNSASSQLLSEPSNTGTLGTDVDFVQPNTNSGGSSVELVQGIYGSKRFNDPVDSNFGERNHSSLASTMADVHGSTLQTSGFAGSNCDFRSSSSHIESSLVASETSSRRSRPSFLDSLNVPRPSLGPFQITRPEELFMHSSSKSNGTDILGTYGFQKSSMEAESMGPSSEFTSSGGPIPFEHSIKFSVSSSNGVDVPKTNTYENSIEKKQEFYTPKQNEDFSALEQHIEDLTQEKFSLQRALEASRALAESLAAENSSMTDTYNQQRGIVNQLKSDMEMLQEEIRSHLAELESIKIEYANAQLECNAADERAKLLASEVIGLEEKALRLRSNELKLERELEKSYAEITSYKKKMSSLEKDRQDLQSTIDALQEEKKVLQSKLRKASVSGKTIDVSRSPTEKKDVSTTTVDLDTLNQETHETALIPGSDTIISPMLENEQSIFEGSSVYIPAEQLRIIQNINALISELALEKEELTQALASESSQCSKLKDLNNELSRKLEAQTQRLELLTTQSMASGAAPARLPDHRAIQENTPYADEGDEVVERVLGWIMKLFPGGPSKRRTSKLL